ncbi:hypothetical protein [Clostridium estertheticum]|uniref:hypothetical protein n=1 Tax=Clostridium estertheticum TaxID=238834 RepID=UPI001CF42EC9|nr:hypothetical protein [Clostridium estertheticum]MCB2354723.1 hypothetical protein [Clostridium estertheticum]WAG40965.1 hypothetical protein LL065_22425 [Clostridium estertheticum]
MALKKVKRPEVISEVNTNKEGENKMQNIFNNSVGNEMDGEVKSSINDVIHSHMNTSSDDFFKTEELSGVGTPITNLEIELTSFEVIPEGRYQFLTKEVGIDNMVSTAYGIKNQMWLKFYLDGEAGEYDTKQKYNISASYKSKFYGVYNALVGEAPKGKINLKNLLEIGGYCEIQHVLMDNGDIFPRVINIQVQ